MGLALDELIKNDNLDTTSAVKEVTGQIVDIDESALIPTIDEKMRVKELVTDKRLGKNRIQGMWR